MFGTSQPRTLSATAQEFADSVSEADRIKVRNREPTANDQHLIAGLSMRNEWALWDPNSSMMRDAVETYGIAHADDISSLIIAWAIAIVRGNKFDPIEYCQRFHKHWEKLGTDALTAGGWTDG